MRLVYAFVCVVFCTQILFSTEYVYPVVSLNDATILYIHQTSPQNIQLFQWNTITNCTEQILWSLYNPAGIQLLPNNKGFSFIDNGRLRIKAFHKRSAKTIDFDKPIYNINGLQWLDEHTCYCSAYYDNHAAIFELNDEGYVYCVMKKDTIDCMYPQKINDQLFYIERYKKGNDSYYSIMKTPYKQDGVSQILMDFEHNPIIFLYMISETEGFVVEHQKDIDSESCESNKAVFHYHHMRKKDNNWHHNLLFSFEIPTRLFLYNNDQRLFESILPLLPRVINDKIYFVDCLDDCSNMLQPYYYDLATNQKNKVLVEKQKGHFFVPIQCGTQLCFGGTLGSESPLFCFLT